MPLPDCDGLEAAIGFTSVEFEPAGFACGVAGAGVDGC